MPRVPDRPDRTPFVDAPRRAALRGIGAIGAIGGVGALAFGAGLAGLASATRAAPTPEGPVVLVVRGRVRRPNGGDAVRFDMATLERLPQKRFRTRTPWYAAAREFTGPLVRDVLDSAGADGATMRVSALNDYRVDVPVDDALRHDLTLARLIDGQPMPVRDKGPLFMIYPFDDHPELRSAVYYSRSVWQVKSIEIA